MSLAKNADLFQYTESDCWNIPMRVHAIQWELEVHFKHAPLLKVAKAHIA
jgi:hypothetical protein